jgi:glycosyltransferase involved in cell wall biosynthesis
LNIIINTSTCVSGGGIQVCSNLIIESLKDNNNRYYYLLSKEVNNYLYKQKIIISNNAIIFDKSPANIFFRMKFKKIIDKVILNFNPNLIFTVFGPSYIYFKIKHLVGFADPWVTHSNKYAFKVLNIYEDAYRRLLTLYKLFYLRNEKYIWVETILAKNGLIDKLDILPDNIFVIPNSCNPLYYNRKLNHKFDKLNTKIFILTAYYKHKNLEILFPLIMNLIKNNFTNFQFVLTLPENSSFIKKIKKNLIINKYIINIGPLSVQECINNYEDCSIVFLPTLLENISAVYLESILLNKIFVTTNFDFAKDICKDSCLYYEPMNPNDAYYKLIEVFENETLRNELYANQNNIKIISPSNKFDYYLNTFKKIL